jgi:hypothetical protein
MKSKKYPEPKPAAVEQSKIAEPVASYAPPVTMSVTKPKVKSRRIAGLEASEEVWNFAQKHRLVPHLETAVRLVKESFHDIRKIHLSFEPDPEIPGLDGIAINIKVGGTLDELVKQDQVFALRFIKALPNEHRSKISLFVGGA